MTDPRPPGPPDGAASPPRPLISVVMPCFNEEEVLPATLARLRAVCDALPAQDFEILCIDDGSHDRTAELLHAAAAADPRLRVLSLARNFGHQLALTAGIDAARGDAVVLIDADLQDPPELIGSMIAAWREGADVVYGTRTRRAGESAFKRTTADGFYRILNWLSEVPIPRDTGDFRLIGREAVEVLRQMPERHRFLRGMVAWAGFRQVALPYERQGRVAGATKYPLRRMLAFAADGILSFSTKPLAIATWVGLASACLAFLGIVYALFMRLFTSTWVEGWTALMIAVLFLGGIQLLCLGILGQYVGRIYGEAKGRPLYVLKSRRGDRLGPEPPV